MSRAPISTRQRFEIFKRDGFTCQYCGATPPKAILHVDHINPVKLGGGNGELNLITACSNCNLGKAAVPLTSHPVSLAEKAADLAEREAQILGYAAIMDAARDRVEQSAWRVAEVLKPGASDGYSIANLASIKRFLQDLGIHEVLEAADITNLRRARGSAAAFKYFCGVCWHKIKDAD